MVLPTTTTQVTASSGKKAQEPDNDNAGESETTEWLAMARTVRFAPLGKFEFGKAFARTEAATHSCT